MSNHCLVINDLGVCSNPSADCEFFRAGWDDCYYICDHRCCHARAIMTSTRRDRRSAVRGEEQAAADPSPATATGKEVSPHG